MPERSTTFPDAVVTTARHKAIAQLDAEASALRGWADQHLPEMERVALYVSASRLESLAAELARESQLERLRTRLARAGQDVLTHLRRSRAG